jgi:hypothetical protein
MKRMSGATGIVQAFSSSEIGFENDELFQWRLGILQSKILTARE